MKKILLNLLLVFVCGSLVAQKDYEKSESFPEFDGWTKLIQLNNGNTGLMELTKDKGINFTLFNPQRKKITSGQLPLKNFDGKLVYCQIEGCYEIGGDFVAFIGKEDPNVRNKPAMYRIIVNGSTGKLKSEEKIEELPQMNMGDGYAMMLGDMDMPRIVVEKDPESEYYVVVKYDTKASETIDRILVSHYGPDHKLLNKAKYNTPTDKYKYTKFLSAYVKGSEYVLINTLAFNTKKSGGDEMRYYVAQLNNGKTTFNQKELQYTEFDKKATSRFVINTPMKTINMILIINNTMINQYVNPTSMALDKPYALDMTNVNKLYKTELTNKDDFAGIPQGTFVDQKGNVTFLFQELQWERSKYSINTIFGDVALVTMTPEGKEISSAVFPCSIFRKNDHNAYSYDDCKKGRRVGTTYTPVADNDWYYGMDFISTDNASYLFFNNRLDNMEKPEAKEAGRITGISGTAGVKYTYKDSKLKKEFFISKPANKKEAKFINPGSSDWDAETKTYATIQTDGETKQASVIWTKLD